MTYLSCGKYEDIKKNAHSEIFLRELISLRGDEVRRCGLER